MGASNERKAQTQGLYSQAEQAQIALKEASERASFGHVVNSLSFLGLLCRSPDGNVDLRSFLSQRRSTGFPAHSSRALFSPSLRRSVEESPAGHSVSPVPSHVAFPCCLGSHG